MQDPHGIERGLPAHGRQDRLRPLIGDHFGDEFRCDRLDIGHIRRLGIGHNGRWIGIDQDDLVALFAQRFAGLGTRIVKLARLADDDRPGTDHQNFFNILPLWHRCL